MKIYKSVPEQFHIQFVETLEGLKCEEEKTYSRHGMKRMLSLVATLVFVLSTITVSAAAVFIWHQAAKDNLGVSEELAEQMVQEGVAKQEGASDLAEGVKVSAIQSVMTGDYCYVLLSVTVPDGIAIDEDTLFRDSYVESDVAFNGCVINLVLGSNSENTSLWEVQLLTSESVDYRNVKANIILNDLVKTQKTEIVETLVAGEWTISLTLPSEPETLNLNEQSIVQIGCHEVNIERTEVSPWEIRLYGDEEQLQHAIHYQAQDVVGIVCQDGTVIDEATAITVANGHTNENTGEYYIAIDLPVAIDITQYSGILVGEIEGTTIPMTWTDDKLAQMTVLYEQCGHKLMFDSAMVVLWDENCEVGREIINVGELGYDEARGDSMEVGPGGKNVQVTVNGKVYTYNVMY